MIRFASILVLLISLLFVPQRAQGALALPLFIRGDVNGDTQVQISDVITLLSFLFSPGQGQSIDCLAAADVSPDQQINIADAIALLGGLFGGATIPEPYPFCGFDPDSYSLGCNSSFGSCPPAPFSIFVAAADHTMYEIEYSAGSTNIYPMPSLPAHYELKAIEYDYDGIKAAAFNTTSSEYELLQLNESTGAIEQVHFSSSKEILCFKMADGTGVAVLQDVSVPVTEVVRWNFFPSFSEDLVYTTSDLLDIRAVEANFQDDILLANRLPANEGEVINIDSMGVRTVLIADVPGISSINYNIGSGSYIANASGPAELRHYDEGGIHFASDPIPFASGRNLNSLGVLTNYSHGIYSILIALDAPAELYSFDQSTAIGAVLFGPSDFSAAPIDIANINSFAIP